MEEILDQAEMVFSGEEGYGRFLDLHQHYMEFCNIKKLRQLGLIESADYLSWLKNFDKFHIVPIYIKQSSKYEIYV